MHIISSIGYIVCAQNHAFSTGVLFRFLKTCLLLEVVDFFFILSVKISPTPYFKTIRETKDYARLFNSAHKGLYWS